MNWVDVRDDRLLDLVDDRPPEVVATGFAFTEGPVWVADRGLLFSDVRGNARYLWDGERTHRVAAPTGHGNGMTLDADGQLVVCEHDTSVVVRMDPDGTGSGREILASHCDGLELNSPNDVVVSVNGGVYFTDPPWGRMSAAVGVERDRQLDFAGVLRTQGDGSVDVLADDFETPNGLCFSPDESLLYVNDTYRGEIRVFPVRADGTLAEGRIFASGIEHSARGAVDGMKCDALGNVWVTGPGGIWVYAPEGTLLGILSLAERAGNLHWGGPDWSWLLVAASTSILRLQTKVRGRREPFMGV